MPKRQKVLLVILGVVVIIFIYMTYFSDSNSGVGQGNPMIGKPPTAQAQQNAARVTQNAVQGKNAASVSNQTAGAVSKPVAVFEGTWGTRDPFYRKVVKAVERAVEESGQKLNLVLNGVQRVNGKSVAVINNKTYWEDEIVDGKRLVKVEKDYVVLRDNNKEYILKLGGYDE